MSGRDCTCHLIMVLLVRSCCSRTDECRSLECRLLDMRTGVPDLSPANTSPAEIYIETVLPRTMGAVLPRTMSPRQEELAARVQLVLDCRTEQTYM